LTDKIESALRCAYQEGRKEIEKELMCELRDPCGTIWEHAKKQQDKMDSMKAEHLKVLEAILAELMKNKDYGRKWSISQTINLVTDELGKMKGE
jgi:hypothetical protein